MKSIRHIRGTYWLIIAAMAFFTMAASSPQCAQTSDRALNPGFGALSEESDCVQACSAISKADKAAEKARYREAVETCNGDNDCKQNESAIHSMILKEINEDKEDCKAACLHEQGGSIGGQ